jgi:predicted alpha/beta-hydrolase family hydrolase
MSMLRDRGRSAPSPLKTGAAPALVYRADAGARAALVLAHGAGAGQHSAFVTGFARGIAARDVDVVTFDFPYMAARRRIPDRGPALEACYLAVVDAARAQLASARAFLFVGGKSMGGRIATQVAAADPALPVAGLALLGYPLHPPGKPAQRRDAHLPDIRRPMLFVQGSRDAFGTPAELRPILARLTPAPALRVVEGGDHSLKVPRLDAAAQAAVYDDVWRVVVEWIASVIA